MLLSLKEPNANATVTQCHTGTRDIPAFTKEADILVVAVGRAGFVTADMVKPGAAVLDVGITRTDAGLVGDVAPDVREVAGWLAPMPGGVGPMTIALLLRNAVEAAERRAGEPTIDGRPSLSSSGRNVVWEDIDGQWRILPSHATHSGVLVWGS